METNNKIVIKDLWKTLPGKEVLRGLNLEIKERETLVIIGRSGEGKSVLLKHISRLMQPDKGEIYIDDTEITKLPEEQLNTLMTKLGFLFQGAALFDSLTIEENVGFFLFRYRLKELGEKRIKEIVKEKLELVGLKNIENMKPAELSGGMKKRVGLARAIAVDPEIMLYDEPTTGLDPITSDAINDLIIDMQKKINVTSIVVTHDMTSAFKVADRIAMLYQGKIIYIGTPEEVKNTSNPFVKQFISGSAEGPIQA